MLRPALTIAGNDLCRHLRDRSAIIQAFLAPLALALVISLAFGGTSAVDVTIGFVDLDRTQLSKRLAEPLLDDDQELAVNSMDGIEQARGDIDAGKLDAAIVIPSGFEDVVVAGQRPNLDVLINPARPIAGDIAQAIAQGIAGRVDAGRLAASLNPDQPGRAAQLAAAMSPSVELFDESVGGGYDAGSYFAPSMAILFLFLTLGNGARSLLTEGHGGTLTRLRSLPIAPRAIVIGKTLSVFVLGLASFGTVYAITTIGFDAEWGPVGAVITIIVVTTAAVAALSILVTSLARTEGQAQGYTSVLTFGLALLGGNFVTPGAAPDLLRSLSRLTPNGWALSAFTDLAAGDAGLGELALPVVVLAGITAIAGGIGLAITDRQVTA